MISRLKFALRGKDVLGASGEVFLGEAAIFEKNPMILEVKLPNCSWQLAAVPAGGWQDEALISLLLLLGGVALALSIGVLVYIWVRSPKKLQKAVEEATTALRESEAKYRELVENANSIILRTDPQGNITFFNEFAQNFFGYSESEIVGKNLIGTIVPATDSSGRNLAESIGGILQNPEKYKRQENEYICRNGERVWIAWRCKALFDKNGKFSGLLCIGNDISDRKRTEKALRTSQEMLRLVIDNIPQTIFWKDRNSVYQGCNRKFALDVGLEDPAQVIGKTDYDFCADKSLADSFREVDRGVMETNTPINQCEFLLLPNNREVCLETNKILLHDAEGNVVGIIVTHEDVTERKQTEEALRESEKKFRLLFEQSGDAILLLQDDKFIDCNQAAVEMMRASSKEELLNLHPSQLSPEMQPDGRSSFEKANENNALALSRGSLRFEWVHRRLDNSNFTVEVLLTAIPLQGKPILHVVWRDITERKWAEETLKASERRLRQQSSALLHLATGNKLTCGDLNAAIKEITEVAVRTLDVERASVWLYNQDRSAIVCLDLYQRTGEHHSSGIELKAVDYPAYFQALQTERIIPAHDVQTDPRTLEFFDNYLSPLGISSMLDAPIRLDGQMVGVICHEHVGTPRQWTLDEENFAGSLADFAALAIEGASRRGAQEALQKVNEELENRVEERTAALRETNRQLLVEVRERQRSETALRMSEAKFSKAFNSSPDVMTITRIEDGHYVDVNETFLQSLGFQKEEVIGRTSLDLNIWANPEDRTRLLEIVQKKGTVRNLECEFRTKSGEILMGLLSAEIIYLDGDPCLLVVSTDITELKKTEEALRQAEEKYRKIFENAVEGIYQTSPDGRYISANPALARLYGYFSPEELIDNINNIEQQLYVDPNRRAEFIARMEKDNAVSSFESQIYRKDRSIIWVSENARAVRDFNGTLLYYEGIVEDITLRKVTEQALLYQKQQTESLLLNILPQAIADRLKREETTIADSFAEATVLFADLVGFTELSAHIPPVELVEMLNEIFSTFDKLTEQHGLEKIKTIGDAYMVVGGLPIHRSDHAEAVAEMALDMQMEINRFNNETHQKVQLRVGINTGPVVAGVIGIKKFIYDLWGDTVNTASRMESHGIAGGIQVTAATYERLRDKYLFQERGTIQIKGKGAMTTYLLVGRI